MPMLCLILPNGGFNVGTTLLAQGNPLRREQVFFGLLAILAQLETDLDAPVAFCLGALGFERAGAAFRTLIETTLGEIAILRTIGARLAVGQGVVGRADEFVFVSVIG